MIANGDITGDVRAGLDAVADSLGTVHANVTASTGDATVSALGDYYGFVEAGSDATVTVGGEIVDALVDAGRHVQVSAHGGIQMLEVLAGHNADVLSDTSITESSITAGTPPAAA